MYEFEDIIPFGSLLIIDLPDLFKFALYLHELPCTIFNIMRKKLTNLAPGYGVNMEIFY